MFKIKKQAGVEFWSIFIESPKKKLNFRWCLNNFWFSQSQSINSWSVVLVPWSSLKNVWSLTWFRRLINKRECIMIISWTLVSFCPINCKRWISLDDLINFLSIQDWKILWMRKIHALHTIIYIGAVWNKMLNGLRP